MDLIKPDYVIKDKKVVHPDITTDGLELYYDTKGKKNSDTYKDTLLDMSGNDRHGELQEFSYKNQSGYTEEGGLVFDGVDDKLKRADVDNIEVVSATKNLFDGFQHKGYYINSQSGQLVKLESRQTSGYIKVKPNTTYTLEIHESSTMKDNIGQFTKNFNYIKNSGRATPDKITFTTEANAEYIMVTIRSELDELVQLEEGSTATPYVPYIPTAKMTYQLNNNIISYGEDGSVKWVKDGKVMERKGVNILKGSVLSDRFHWRFAGGSYQIIGGEIIATKMASSGQEVSMNLPYIVGSKYYISAQMKTNSVEDSVLALDKIPNAVGNHSGSGEWERIEIIAEPDGVPPYSANTINIRFINSRREGDISDFPTRVKEPMIIDLTATFGAGNEPTLEEIQAEPDKWQWLPNPMDLLEAKELNGNILGDMEDIIDDHTRDEQSGVEVFTDKADDSLVRVEVDGKSVGGGRGKNLLANSWVEKESDSASISTSNIMYYLTEDLEEGKTYTLSFLARTSNDGDTAYVWLRDINGGDGIYSIRGARDRFPISSTYEKYTFTFQLNRSGTEAKTITVTNRQANAPENSGTLYVKDIQIEEGSTATPYELPAPTPDYPIEIHSLNDFDVVSSVEKRNLLSYNFENFVTDAGTYDFYKLTDENVDLTITVTDKDPSVDLAGVFFGLTSNGYNFRGTARWSFADGTIRNPQFTLTGANYFSIYGGKRHKIFDRFDIKIEKGSNATPWSPAPEDITEDDNHPLIDKINLSLSEPLRSVGDVKDRLFRDSDGLWKIERNVANKGIEDMMSVSTYSGSNEYHFNGGVAFLIYYLNSQRSVSTKDILSSYFKKVETNNYNAPSSEVNTIHQLDYTRFSIRVPESTIGVTYANTTQEKQTAFRNWAIANDVRVQYILGEPTIETLDQELQDKLNNLRSFQDSNYVYTVINDKTDILSPTIQENLKPTLHGTFKSKDYLKENRTFNSLKIYSRPLSDEEMLKNYATEKRRFPMASERIENPTTQTISLTQGGYTGNVLSLDYTLEI